MNSTNKYLGGIEAVREFMIPSGQTINESPMISSDKDVYLRSRLILEEVTEFIFAALGKTEEASPVLAHLGYAMTHLMDIANKGVAIKEVDMQEMFDAVIDIEVINLGTALTFGFPVEDGFKEVHRSNMSKILPDGTCLRDDNGKILKPEGYSPPDLKTVLLSHLK